MSSHAVASYLEKQKPIDLNLQPTASPTVKWLHHHPTIQKAAAVGLGAIGVKILIDGLQNFSFYQTTFGAIL